MFIIRILAKAYLRDVPVGRCDRSLARSAWKTPSPKRPSRRVRCDLRRCAHRFDDWRRVFSLPQETPRTFRREIPLGLAAPDHTVPYGTVLSRDAFPGTSCQATIVLSLRDALADISQLHLAKAYCEMSRRENTAHISMRNTCGIRCARSYRTLRDGSFEGRFPRHFMPGYDRCCPYVTRFQTFRNSIKLVVSAT